MKTDRERSRSPHRSDGGSTDGSWRCSNCCVKNGEDTTRCSKCRLEKGKEKSEVYKEDWECPKCKCNNFSRRIDCFKCFTRKPPADPKHPNDWECRKCKGINFSRRLDCFQCKEPKPNFISSQNSEWFCGCGFKNYTHRTECFKCHAPKADGNLPNIGPAAVLNHSNSRYYDNNMNSGGGGGIYGVPQGGILGGQGQIIGGTSGGAGMVGAAISRMRSSSVERGIRSRSPIRSFHGGIPERAPDVDPLTGESEWLCPVCGIENFYKRFDCYRCHEKKPINPVLATARDYSDLTASDPMTDGYSTIPSQQYPSAIPNQYPLNSAPMCNAAPSGPLTIPKKRFASDWICPGCHGLNYSKRLDCFKCRIPKPDEGGDYGGNEAMSIGPGRDSSLQRNPAQTSGRQSEARPGDWICPGCGGNNFSRRTDCFKCQQAKPSAYNMEVAPY